MKPTAIEMHIGLVTFILVLACQGALAIEYDLVISNGRVMNPASGLDSVRHVGITDGRISTLSREPISGKTEVDASGLVVAPGFIDAGMSAPFFKDEAVRKQRGGGVPLRRLGTAEDVAKAVMFLASEDAAYISGQEIAIDGGVINSVLAQLPRERPAE